MAGGNEIRLARPLLAAGALGALALVLLLALAMTPAQGAIRPQDFDVSLEMGPGDPQQSEPNCSPPAGGFITCTNEFSFDLDDEFAEGTVTHAPSGLSGAISMLYSMDMSERFVIRFPIDAAPTPYGLPEGSEVVEFEGSGSQSGAWQMRFDDRAGSTMEGMMSGRHEMELIDAATATVEFGSEFKVQVVSGSGYFADQVGTGRFCHRERFSLFGPPPNDGQEGPPDGECGPSGDRAGAAAAGGDSQMSLRLRSGKFRVRIVGPRGRLARGDATNLSAVSAPRAACRARAKRGKRSRSLGKARADSSGAVQFRGALARRLGKGRSKVKVACSLPDGKRKLTARTARKLRVR